MILLIALALGADADVLVVGNSYAFFHGVDQHVDALLQEGLDLDVDTQQLARPGYRFVDHVAATAEPGPWRDALVAVRHWDWVILQEQSQIPGFPVDQADLVASRAAAQDLDALAANQSATTMLLATWGRRDGDATNPTLYPDFETMNDRLLAGYLGYADLLTAAGRTAYVAPAGLAFARVHDDLVDEGQDPLDSGSAFGALYDADGSHPSAEGTYLAACVVYAALTGRDPVGLEANPGGLATNVRLYDQDVARRVVLEAPFGDVPYPWAKWWPLYEPPGDVTGEGLAISGVVTRPYVRLDGDAPAEIRVVLGAWHESLDRAGDGRLWVTTGGGLDVSGALVVGDAGAGEVEHTDGAVRVGELLLATMPGSAGHYALSGGRLEVGGLRYGEGEGSFAWTGGTLAVGGGIAGPIDGPGTLEVVSDAVVSGGLSATDLRVVVGDSALPVLDVDGTFELTGAIRVEADAGVTPPGEGQVVARATAVAEGGVTLDAPDGWRFGVVDLDDGRKGLELSWAVDGPGGGDSGCKCAQAPDGASWGWLVVALVGARRARRR